jgi:hypothetical protein
MRVTDPVYRIRSGRARASAATATRALWAAHGRGARREREPLTGPSLSGSRAKRNAFSAPSWRPLWTYAHVDGAPEDLVQPCSSLLPTLPRAQIHFSP